MITKASLDLLANHFGFTIPDDPTPQPGDKLINNGSVSLLLREIPERRALPDMLGARLVEILKPIIGGATNDDGIDPEAWWIELTADEHRELKHLVLADEQLSGPDGDTSAKTESK